MTSQLGEILPADRARQRLVSLGGWTGVATYMLWNFQERRPLYCGTAKSPRRLLGHLDKDDLANRPAGKTHVNPELRAYCLSQPKGWLGVSFRVFDNKLTANSVERQIIAEHGIRRRGGILFNQRESG